MASEGEAVALPMRAALQAKDVVAAGRVDNVLQVPSPTYTAEFTDAHHVLIGAGGGGRRFGMANIALLLRVSSLAKAEAATTQSPPPPPPPSRKPAQTADAATADGAPSASSSVWSFASAIDLGVNIPWCTSAFLPFSPATAASSSSPPMGSDPASAAAVVGSATDPCSLSWSSRQRRVLEGIVGFIALSSISAFTLLGVYAGTEPTTAGAEGGQTASGDAAPTASLSGGGAPPSGRYLRQLARIVVPHDEKDPDKKPIALTQNLLVVAHDRNGVYAYALADLVPDSFEDDDERSYLARYAEQLKPPHGALQRRVPCVQTTATPVAEWQLPARVNDLAVNRLCIVQASPDSTEAPSSSASPLQAASASASAASAGPPCKAHLQEHAVLVAVLQNKTVELSTLRLHRRYGTRVKGTKGVVGRSVGSNGTSPGQSTQTTSSAATLWMGTALTLTQAELPLPFKLLTSSLRLVRLYGWNNIDGRQQAEMRRQLTWQSLQEKGKPTHGPLCSVMLVAFDTHACQSYMIHGAVEVSQWPLGSSSSSSCGLGLKVNWTQRQPTAVLADAITSLSLCADATPGDYEARLRRSPVGAAVPTHFIVGTVEGWVASVRWVSAERRWRSDHIRPSPLHSVAARFPALHKEPVSCVAVSAENDVVSADIAQNVALTTVPYALRSSSSRHDAEAVGGGNGHVVQPRVASASPLFPTSMADAGVLGWAMQELKSGSARARVFLFLLMPLLLLFVALIIMRR